MQSAPTCFDRRFWPLTSVCVLLVLVLATLFASGCGGQTASSPNAQRSRAAFIITDGAALLSALPSSTASPAPPASTEVQDQWSNPVVAWMQIGMQAVSHQDQPEAARSLAYLAAGLHDGLLVADLARAGGMAVSDDALLSTIAQMILSVQAPLQQTEHQALARTATWVGVWQERSTPQAVANGRAIGQAVAVAILTVAAEDRAVSAAANPPAVYRPVDPVHGGVPPVPEPAVGVWQLTPPRYLPPHLPHWGALRPVGFVHLDDLDVAVSPAWDDRRFVQARDSFAQIQADRAGVPTAQSNGPTAPSAVVAVWMQQTHTQITQAQLRGQDAARVYAATTAALHNGFILAYRGKYAHMVARPITWMQQHDSNWAPAHETPATPSYPCDATLTSAAAAAVLSRAFPGAQDAFMARHAALMAARVTDGLQWPLDVTAGDDLGTALGRRLAERVN